MPRRLLITVAFLLLLVPSAWYAWSNRDMPQLGRAHDDAIYLTVAKSLAEGTGYRIQNLPGEPFQTKYPPLAVLPLVAVWKLNPSFPANLPLATLAAWIMIPPFLLLTWVWLGRAGLSERTRWASVALLAVSPYTVSFGSGVFSEVLFGILLLGSLLGCERAMDQKSWRWALAAGVLGGLAYWTRTAGIVALVAAPAVFWWRKRRREAVTCFAATFVFVASWTLYVALHKAARPDVATLYNTDYLGFMLKDVRITDLQVLVWENLGRMLHAIGGLIFPVESANMLLAMLRVTTAVGIFHGLYQQRANPRLTFYFAFGVLTVAELLVWHFPPNLRLMYPLLPLLLVGAVAELKHFAAMMRGATTHKDASQRTAAKLVGVAAGLLAAYGLWMQWNMSFIELPAMTADQGQIRAESRAAFEWLAANSASTDNVLCLNPAVYLYAGRRTQSLFPMPIFWYRGDTQRMLKPIRDLPLHGAAYPMQYFYVHDADYEAFAPGHAEEAKKMVTSNPGLIAVFQNGAGVLYRLVDPARLADRQRQ